MFVMTGHDRKYGNVHDDAAASAASDDHEDGDDGDSPFGRMTATIEEVEGEDSSDDEPHDDELYVEEDETVMEESREAWRALRICLVFYVFFQPSQ